MTEAHWSVNPGLVIKQYLAGRYPDSRQPGVLHCSSFESALSDARGASNRDLATGDRLGGVPHMSWLGAIGYLSLLDQLGSAVRPKGSTLVPHERPVRSALRYFAPVLTEAQRNAIYALRCALAHDYSLIHRHGATNYRFHLSGHEIPGAVAAAAVAWDGDLSNPSPDTITVVSVPSVCDLVESVAGEVRRRADQDDLEIALNGGIEEMVVRFGFTFEPQDQ